MSARQKAEAEAITVVKKWMKDWYETMIYERDPSMEALALRVSDALESKIKEIESVWEAAGKLKDAVKSMLEAYVHEYSNLSQCDFDDSDGDGYILQDCAKRGAEEALKQFDKVMGGEK